MKNKRIGGKVMQIGLKIKEIRERNNVSQAILAEKIGTLTQSQISKIEIGKRCIRVNAIAAIAKVFNVPVKDIVT